MNPLVPRFLLAELARGRRRGRLRAASLFADISGFTALTEALTAHGREGAELLAASLVSYFDPVVREIEGCGGFVTTFAGDALTALFPSRSDRVAARRGAEAARRISAIFREQPRRRNRFGEFSFAVKVGLSHGDVEWGIEGEPPSAYWFHGPAVSGCAAAEHAAAAGEIAGDGPFLRALGLEHGSAPAGARVFEPAPSPPGRLPKSPAGVGGESFSPEGLDHLPAEGEFRDVTALFLGFDAGASPAEIAECVSARVRAFGGSLSRVDFGDKGALALVFFGAPLAHEDDPARALELFLDLRDRSSVGGVRGGLARGIVWAGRNGASWRHDFTCQGNPVNMAARLMVRASRGGAVVSDAVRSGALGSHRFSDGERVPLKGFSEPVEVFRLEGRRGDGSSRGTGSTSVVVGREAEVESLLARLLPLGEGRFAGVTVLSGEAGAGKSTLVDRVRDELPRRLPRRTLWIETSCDPVLRRPLNPFERALRLRFDWGPDDPPDAAMARLAHGVERIVRRCRVRDRDRAAELERLAPWLGGVCGFPDPDPARRQVEPQLRMENQFAALAAWVRAEASLVPVVVRIEDAHAIDRESRRAVAAMVRELQGLPVAFLVDWRPGERHASEGLDLPAGVPYLEVELGALNERDLARLVEAIAGAPPAPSLVRLVAERSGGVPLFAEQLVRLLHDEGALEEGAGGLELARGAPPLPGGAAALLVARLDRLPGAVRRIVQSAAILGAEPPVDLLGDLVAEGGGGVDGAVEAATAAGIWRPQGDGRLVFHHALMRDAAYEMQSMAVRRRLHARAGELLERRGGEATLARLRDLAWHFESAEEAEKAVAWISRAAEAARGAKRTSEALDLHERLVRWLPPTGGETRATWTAIAEEREQLSRGEEALDACRKAEEAAGEGEEKDRDREWALSRVRNRVLRSAGRLREARAAAREFLARAREAGDEGAVGAALLCLGVGEVEKGNPKRAAELLAGAITRLSLGDLDRDLVLARIALSTLEFDAGAFESARAELLRAREVAKKRRDGWLEGVVALNLGAMEASPDEAIVWFERALAVFEEAGDRRYQSVCLNNLGSFRFRKGDIGPARELFVRASRIHERLGRPDGVVTALGNIAECDLALGKPLDAVAALEAAEGMEGANFEVVTFILLTHADALRALGRWPEAWSKLAEAEGLMERFPSAERLAEHRLIRGRLRALQSDVAGAVEDFREAGRIAGEQFPHLAKKANFELLEVFRATES